MRDVPEVASASVAWATGERDQETVAQHLFEVFAPQDGWKSDEVEAGERRIRQLILV